LKNGLLLLMNVPTNFADSQRAKKFEKLAEASSANPWLKKPGMAFLTDCYGLLVMTLRGTRIALRQENQQAVTDSGD